MPLSDLNMIPDDPTEDNDPADETHAMPLKTTERAGDALARFMLEAALTPALRRLLVRPSRLIIMQAADETGATVLASYLQGPGKLRRRSASCYTERNKIGGRLEAVGRGELARLGDGFGVVLVSQDPEGILAPEAMAAADAVIAVPNPTLSTVRNVIRAVTGKRARGLVQSDIEGLGVRELLLCIRPGLSPSDCVRTLRRAAAFKAGTRSNAIDVAPLEQLAMTRELAGWASETLDLMRRIQAGTASASALRFGCLEGPPGTGKTTVVAALARSAGWDFAPTSIGEWFASSGGHLGDVIRAARTFFSTLAQSKVPIVGLLDEIDALPNRATLDPQDRQWWSSVITFVLIEIDRLRKAGKPILLVAATNHFGHLDAALIRPGRLEHRVSVLLPNEGERRAMFATCLGNKMSEDELSSLARLAVLATPAQIESWCKSATAAAQVAERTLTLRDLVDLIAPRGKRSDRTDHSVALHEAGHAVVAYDLGVSVTEISIIHVGTAGGWVNTTLDDPLMTKEQVERFAAVMLGGRAADLELGIGAHAGASSDLESVNRLLRSAMLDLGLYGPLTTGPNNDTRNWPRPGITLTEAVSREIDRSLTRALEIVRRRRKDVAALAQLLIVERVVTGDGLAQLLGHDTPVADTRSDGASAPRRA